MGEKSKKTKKKMLNRFIYIIVSAIKFIYNTKWFVQQTTTKKYQIKAKSTQLYSEITKYNYFC